MDTGCPSGVTCRGHSLARLPESQPVAGLDRRCAACGSSCSQEAMHTLHAHVSHKCAPDCEVRNIGTNRTAPPAVRRRVQHAIWWCIGSARSTCNVLCLQAFRTPGGMMRCGGSGTAASLRAETAPAVSCTYHHSAAGEHVPLCAHTVNAWCWRSTPTVPSTRSDITRAHLQDKRACPVNGSFQNLRAAPAVAVVAPVETCTLIVTYHGLRFVSTGSCCQHPPQRSVYRRPRQVGGWGGVAVEDMGGAASAPLPVLQAVLGRRPASHRSPGRPRSDRSIGATCAQPLRLCCAVRRLCCAADSGGRPRAPPCPLRRIQARAATPPWLPPHRLPLSQR